MWWEDEKFLPLPILELRDYTILELLYATGIRGSELVGIDMDDICLKDKAILIIGRGKRYVFSYISNSLFRMNLDMQLNDF